MKKNNLFLLGIMVISLIIGLLGCKSAPSTQTRTASKTINQVQQPQQQTETQPEKYQRLRDDDNRRIRDWHNEGKLSNAGFEAVLQPQVIFEIGEINDAKLSEPGRPYYFKLRAIYKGHDANAKRFFLQDLGTQSNIGDAVWGAAFGIDTIIYPLREGAVDSSELPTDANAIATFLLNAVRFTDDGKGWRGNETGIYIWGIINIEKPVQDPSKFIVANGMRYITVKDAHVTTQENVMAAYFLGSAATNVSNIFDPIVYPLVDLMDARVEMNRKDIRNNATFPTVRVKYVSEVIFRGQSNTTVTVSTNDNVLTERMDFTGRASSVSNGERIRVYYTIAKDPLEKWEIQAIERL